MLEEVIEEMFEELHSAKEYAEKSRIHKMNNNIASNKYMEMAREELKHFDELHSMATMLINEAKENGVEITEKEKIIYDYEHEKAIKKYNEIKVMLEINK